ncbi:hypothetical protein XELAEV_18018016mg [Xenopus laevis]|uniref:Uncharacterized protein n=1 Tax=Xenopus laevis TaxID=8355 RepID=A0A974DDG9_XENLA|nr:hypothetical protein XELAEV_18018016mg [Xenopus laevis]
MQGIHANMAASALYEVPWIGTIQIITEVYDQRIDSGVLHISVNNEHKIRRIIVYGIGSAVQYLLTSHYIRYTILHMGVQTYRKIGPVYTTNISTFLKATSYQ